MNTGIFSFNLPSNLIAQRPADNAKTPRLLVIYRREGKIIHDHFENLADYFHRGDILVLNNTAVIPTRIWGVLGCGGQVEVTLVNRFKANLWEALVRPVNRVRKNGSILFKGRMLTARLLKKTQYSGWLLKFNRPAAEVESFFKKYAQINTPFYIKRDIKPSEYQTAYAKIAGSTQCPTAGLHFTDKLLKRFRDRGIDIAFITLHIGGSVLPLTVRDLQNFNMYREYFEVSKDAERKLNLARKSGNKIIAAGTTVARALETAVDKDGKPESMKGWTTLTIKPGHRFRSIDCFLTNFHMPSSSHLLMTSAFGGIGCILSAYQQALRLKYRFLDFGDAMLIL